MDTVYAIKHLGSQPFWRPLVVSSPPTMEGPLGQVTSVGQNTHSNSIIHTSEQVIDKTCAKHINQTWLRYFRNKGDCMKQVDYNGDLCY